MTDMTQPAPTPTKIYLADYTPPAFLVDKIDLDIRVFDSWAQVGASLTIRRNPKGESQDVLTLFGRELVLLEVALNGVVLTSTQYRQDDEALTIDVKDMATEPFTITTKVKITPHTNTALEGLYQAGTGADTMFVTQCEPEGFRKITFFPDRPDVLSEYTTRVEADKRFVTLLANGNLVEKGDVGDDRHFAIWHDPTKKPSYLFACVVANLDVLTDYYTTIEGRQVLLEIYAAPHDIQKCHVAMTALKEAMAWDEEHYGRAYDLDRYMIVATGQFNMGAMENKGLNIFNTSCVLSTPETTTDERSFYVKSVIAHEYFHNWTGNRITCRDWFQLCLKEGFTVYRDQCFSASGRSSAVQRIEDVATLRATQFPEDAGVLAHPVRPESFVEINNFYTATVYEKGAEIVRMIATLLGRDKFRQGTDEYFRRYDGQAVTIEDFLSAMSVGDERVLDFLSWYRQAGTPVLSGSFDYEEGRVVLNFRQKTRHIAGFDEPEPLPIPIDVAIFDRTTGQMLAQGLCYLTKETDVFIFEGISTENNVRPVVSVLRNFSAPVQLDFAYSDEDLVKLITFEQQGFNRWQAVQLLSTRLLMGQSEAMDLLIDALKTSIPTLIDSDPMLGARLFDLVSEKEMAAAYDDEYDPIKVKDIRDGVKLGMAQGLSEELGVWYDRLPLVPYEDSPHARGVRLLRNIILDLALTAGLVEAIDWAYVQYDNASCMSERLGALAAMIEYDLPRAHEYVQDFYERFSHEALVIDAWFSVQAGASSRDVAFIQKLMEREDYDWHTPNRVRTTLGALASKPTQLWTKQGLALFTSAIAHLDGINPVLASRMLSVLARFYTLTEDKRAWATESLHALQTQATSKNVLEFLNHMLGGEA